MSPLVKNIITYLLMIVITTFLLWFSFRNIHVPEGQTKFDFIAGSWDQADKFLLVLSGLVAVLSHIARAERWRLMLNPIGYRIPLIGSFFSVMVGYFINLVVPRGGELSRCLNLFRLYKVPVETSAGTVVAERLIDVMFLLSFITISFLVQYDKLMSLMSDFMHHREQHAGVQTGISWLIWGLLVIVFAALGLLFYLKKSGSMSKVMDKIAVIWVNLRKGLLSVFTLEKKAMFLFYSLLIWVLYFLMAWLVMLAFHETSILGFGASLTVFTLGSIAMAMPLPGGAGSYHILVPAGLNLFYGLALEKALGFTIVFHAWQTLVLIVFGLLSLVGSQLLNTNEGN